MKITRRQLRQIIKEELSLISESTPADADDDGKTALSNAIKNIKKTGGIYVGWSFAVHPIAGETDITNRITQGRDFKPSGHGGIDYGFAEGTPILAIANGKVEKVYNDEMNGNGLDIKHATVKGVEHKSQYIHMKYPPSTTPDEKDPQTLTPGDSVTAGQTIGLVGNTGSSKGQHLHFQVKQNDIRVDPKIFYGEKQEAVLESQKLIKMYLKQILNEEIDASGLSMTHTPNKDSKIDPRYTQSRQKAYKRHHRSIFALSKSMKINQSRVFSDCGVLSRTGIIVPTVEQDKDVSLLWNYIIDERGNRALFAIAIDELLGIEDVGIVGLKQWMKVAANATGKFLKKWVPYLGQAELAHDVVNIVIEWNKNVEKGFCEVMQLMNQSYWGPAKTDPESKSARRHIKMSEWMMYPGYLALIIHYGKTKGWTSMKIAQVMVSAGWLHPSEANGLRNEILKAGRLKIEIKSKIGDLVSDDSLEQEDTAAIES